MRKLIDQLEESFIISNLPLLAKHYKNKFTLRLNYLEDEIEELKNKNEELTDDLKTADENISELEEELDEVRESYLLASCKGSLEDELKEEWWDAVQQKYTLPQLEEVLGNKFNLKTIK